MNPKEIIKNKISDFLTLCKTHNVESLYAFGSSVNGNFDHANSDIDLLIEIQEQDPISRGEKLMSIWDKFELFFQRKVDLLTDSSIKNPVLKENIDASKVLIYDGQEQKILI